MSRIDRLVAAMTLDEKIGQMNQVFPFAAPKAEALRGGKIGSFITEVDALASLRQELAARGIQFGMARVKSETFVELENGGQLDAIGRENIYATLPTAVAAYREWVAANPTAPAAATATPASTEPDGR